MPRHRLHDLLELLERARETHLVIAVIAIIAVILAFTAATAFATAFTVILIIVVTAFTLRIDEPLSLPIVFTVTATAHAFIHVHIVVTISHMVFVELTAATAAKFAVPIARREPTGFITPAIPTVAFRSRAAPASHAAAITTGLHHIAHSSPPYAAALLAVVVPRMAAICPMILTVLACISPRS